MRAYYNNIHVKRMHKKLPEVKSSSLRRKHIKIMNGSNFLITVFAYKYNAIVLSLVLKHTLLKYKYNRLFAFGLRYNSIRSIQFLFDKRKSLTQLTKNTISC